MIGWLRRLLRPPAAPLPPRPAEVDAAIARSVRMEERIEATRERIERHLRTGNALGDALGERRGR